MKLSKTLKLSSWLVGIYLVLFFCVVVPFHQHSDLKTHDDCPICAVSNQPFVPNVSILVHTVFVLFIILALSKTEIQFFSKDNLHLRSPPLA